MALTHRFGRPIRTDDPILAEEERKRKTRRSWAILVVVVFIVAMIVTNLPRTATLSDTQKSFVALQTEVKNDLLGCNTALRDAFAALQAVETKVSKYQNTVKAIFTQDQSECTIINADLLDLVQANPPTSLERIGVQPGLNAYYAWAFPNADAVIAYSNQLAQHLHDQALINDVRGRFDKMASSLSRANAAFAQVATKLHMSFKPLKLYNLSDVPKGLLS